MKRKIFFILLFLAMAGALDAAYLTWEHYQTNVIIPCYVNPYLPTFFSDCGKVLHSSYSVVFGIIPLALLGLIHYAILTLVILLAITTNKKLFWFWLFIESAAGAIASLYFVYLMVFVIKGICQYCLLSAIISFILFIFAYIWLETERKTIAIYIHRFVYRNIIKPILFLIDPETIHVFMLYFGEFLGKIGFIKFVIKNLQLIKNNKLNQKLAGINFMNPMGLAAGFDYEAKLTQILPPLGFGFETVGTITNMPYEGNPKPMLGRLPKSKSLMVNKGFKNDGAVKIIDKLKHYSFSIPIGVSIGRTNSAKLNTQEKSIKDIVSSFQKFEKSAVKHSYYELNISCPNIIHGSDINFYSERNLTELLYAIEKLNIKKPIFIKMPIEKNNSEVLKMLKIAAKFKNIKGVIFGNLQKNRKDPALYPEEVAKFKVGNFSGKPCEERSNELIKLAYKNFGKRFIIIGCGGVFSAEDAYKKIKFGASLVQLITGLIYEGPQLPAQINLEFTELLKKDNLKNISHAVGFYVK